MLEVHDLSVRYGKHPALGGASLRVRPGEIVVILGANGAGKSTLLKAIGGVCEGRVEGQVTMAGEPVLGLPAHKVVERGIALVPEGRGIFGDLTVRENLALGANPGRAREEATANYERLIRLFPKLADRAGQTARTMSGGEQQMVAIGRAMMSNPVILMLDEPSLGLSPLLSKELFQNLKAVRAAGLGILLVEQNARLSLAIADRGYLLENGQILHEASAEALRNDPAVQAAYLGGAASKSGPAVARPAASPAAAPSVTPAAAPHAAPPAAPPAAPLPEIAPSVTVRARPVRSVPSGDLVGMDIDALVARAAARARPGAPAGARLPSVTRLEPGMAEAAQSARTERMRAALADIEQAARKARERTAPAASSLPPMRPIGARAAAVAPRPAPPAAAGMPPPAPVAPALIAGGRVEVYRRRPGTTQFDRMEVKDA